MNVLITGAAKGLGAALAREFTAQGDAVGALDVLFVEAAPIPAMGSWQRQLDVADPVAWEQLANELTEAGWRPDILLNNAGIGVYGPIQQVAVENWQQQLEISLSGPWYGLKYLTPVMTSGGCVLNIGSHRSLEATAERTAYCAAKFGLRGMSLAAAAELSPDLRVGIVELGAILTDFAGELAHKQQLERQGSYFLDPEEAAKEIVTMVKGEREWLTEWLMRATASGTEVAAVTQALW